MAQFSQKLTLFFISGNLLITDFKCAKYKLNTKKSIYLEKKLIFKPQISFFFHTTLVQHA